MKYKEVTEIPFKGMKYFIHSILLFFFSWKCHGVL